MSGFKYMSLAAIQEKVFAHTDAPHDPWDLSQAQHDAHVYFTIGQMLDFCSKRPMQAPFTARGILVDTTCDIAQQIRGFFPQQIALDPVIDRIAFVCAQRARETGQYLQVVSFDHLRRIQPIDQSESNFANFIEIFSDRRMKLGSFKGEKAELKMAGGGSSGGDAASMIAELRQSEIQGFALQVRSLDVEDEKSKELLANLGLVQAFGGNSAAIADALVTINAGGAQAQALMAAVEQVAEIRTLQAALNNAGDTAAAAPIAAALAIKTEALSSTLPTLPATDVVKGVIGARVEAVKGELTARQIESAVTRLAEALPPSVVGRAANDPVPAGSAGNPAVTTIKIAQAVEAVQNVARANGMPVRDVIALTLANSAPPEMAAAVKSLAGVLTHPQAMPAIDAALPKAVSAAIRAELGTPALQATAQIPVSVASVSKNLAAMDAPTLKLAATALEQTQASPATAAVSAPVIQAVLENLQALAHSKAVPPQQQAALSIVTAQVQALAVQTNLPAAAAPAVPGASPSPLAAIAAATQTTPTGLAQTAASTATVQAAVPTAAVQAAVPTAAVQAAVPTAAVQAAVPAAGVQTAVPAIGVKAESAVAPAKDAGIVVAATTAEAPVVAPIKGGGDAPAISTFKTADPITSGMKVADAPGVAPVAPAVPVGTGNEAALKTSDSTARGPAPVAPAADAPVTSYGTAPVTPPSAPQTSGIKAESPAAQVAPENNITPAAAVPGNMPQGDAPKAVNAAGAGHDTIQHPAGAGRDTLAATVTNAAPAAPPAPAAAANNAAPVPAADAPNAGNVAGNGPASAQAAEGQASAKSAFGRTAQIPEGTAPQTPAQNTPENTASRAVGDAPKSPAPTAAPAVDEVRPGVRPAPQPDAAPNGNAPKEEVREAKAPEQKPAEPIVTPVQKAPPPVETPRDERKNPPTSPTKDKCDGCDGTKGCCVAFNTEAAKQDIEKGLNDKKEYNAAAERSLGQTQSVAQAGTRQRRGAPRPNAA